MKPQLFHIVKALGKSIHGNDHYHARLYPAAVRLRSKYLWPVDGGSMEDYIDSDVRSVHFFATETSLGSNNSADSVVGTVQYDPDTNRLRQLIVDPSFRHHQIGAHLIEAVQQEAIEIHYQELLQVNAWLKSAPFYAKHGFVAQGGVYESKGVLCQVMMYSPEP